MLIPHPAAAPNPPIPNHSNTSPSPPPHPALLLPTCAPQNLYFPAHPGLGLAQSTHQAPAALSGGQLCSLSPSAERGVPGDGRAVSAASRPTVLEPPASLRRSGATAAPAPAPPPGLLPCPAYERPGAQRKRGKNTGRR